MAAGHGDATYIVYGDRRISFAEFRGRPTASPPAWPPGGSATATGWRCCRPTRRSGALTFWATVSLGAILVGLNGWWKTDEVLYGLEDSGAKVLVADAKRLSRIADVLAEGALPDLEAVFVTDAEPGEVGGGRAGSTPSASSPPTGPPSRPPRRSTRATRR